MKYYLFVIYHNHEESLLDSGASCHMCQYKSRFSSYRAIDGNMVLMRNNVSCKTIRIGRNKIKMFHNIVRISIEVRHVLVSKIF